jgi:hypothetical protein
MLFLFNSVFGLAQSPTQVIRGTVVDKESKYPLIGAAIVLIKDSLVKAGAYSDEQGNYRLENVPLGRQSIKVTYLGYKEVVINDVIVNSGRETILNIEMEASVNTMQEVVVNGNGVGRSSNEMSTVSARTFSVEETNLYAGSRGDPARMASNFAGVQGADDSRNDIVIRGNSPSGVLWRVEDVDIFNPNHFNIAGTAGGPVSILNNKILANSDFYTGAFPAEIGNSVAGAFDLKLRNGDNEKTEFSAQVGFLGLEALAEGPISKKKKSSFLFTYRYSSLALFSSLGIDIGTDAIPYYQDGSFRLNFPLKNNANIAFFGIGGMSHINILISQEKTPQVNIYGQDDRDQYFKSEMGLAGATYNKAFNVNTFTKFTLMVQGEREQVHHELVYRHVNADSVFVLDSLVHLLGYDFHQEKVSLAWFLDKKLSSKLSFKTGFNVDEYFFFFLDSIRQMDSTQANYYQFYKRWDDNSTATLAQVYFEIHYKPIEALTINAGIHSEYFSLGNALSPIEPRLGIRYELKHNQSLSLGLGLHSEMQSTYLYFYNPNIGTPASSDYNENMGLTKSYHAVIGYDKAFGRHLYFKVEAYYQYLFDVPVDKDSATSFSLINTGTGFSRFFPDPLVNKGTGKNYGIEFTSEKGFSKNYYFLVTLSLFQSYYTGSDGVERRTNFDGKYAANFIFTKEFVFKNKNVLQLGAKVTFIGGGWYGPVDTVQSKAQEQVVYVDSKVNTIELPAYFRADLKIDYRLNGKKLTHEFGLDIVNVFNTQNVLDLTYSPNEFHPQDSPIQFEYQLGRLPLFYWRVDF